MLEDILVRVVDELVSGNFRVHANRRYTTMALKTRLERSTPDERDEIITLYQRALPSLIQDVQQRREDYKTSVALLGDMGPAAAPAIPALEDMAKFRHDVESTWAEEALAKIRPPKPAADVPAARPPIEILRAEHLYLSARMEMRIGGSKHKALELLNDAIKNDPKHADAYEARSNVFISMNRVDEGIADLLKANELAKESGKPLRDNGIG